MNKSLVFLFVLFFSLLAQAEKKTVLGVSVPLTGDGAQWGESIKNTLLFANEKLAGGRYQFDFQDDRCDPKEAVKVAKYFSDIAKLKQVIGLACSGTVLSSAPIYEKTATTVIVTVGTSPRIANAGPHTFRTAPSDGKASTILANWVKKKLHKKLGIISTQTDYAQDLKDSFIATYKPTAGEIFIEDVLPSDADFRPYFLRMKKAGVDALFLNPQFDGTLELLARDLKLLQWGPKLYAAYYPSNKSVLEKVKGGLNGIEFVDAPSLSELITTEEGEKFYSEFLKTYPRPAFDWIFTSTFEGFRAMDEALQATKGADLPKFLSQAKFKGIIGPWHFDSDGEIEGLKFVMKRIEKNSPVSITAEK